MAKGNDGNLFQHTIEVEAAAFLVRCAQPRRIYFAATHAMAPREAFDGGTDAAKPRTSTVLLSTLRVASGVGGQSENHPLVVRAFAALGASPLSYPNSTSLIEWVAKQQCAELSGAVVEKDEGKAAALRAYLGGSSVRVSSGSWRQDLEALRPPEHLATPWIFSMDPMKFTSGKDEDNDKMTAADLRRLAPLWTEYASCNQPGLVALFSYSMQRDQRQHFLSSVASLLLPLLPGFSLGVLEALNYTSDYHVAAVLSADQRLLQHLRERLLTVIPERSRDRDSFPTQTNLFEVGA